MPTSPSHPSGLPGTDAPRGSCRDCAWVVAGAPLACRAAAPEGAAPVAIPDGPGCASHEPTPRCEDCGACCREAFDSVPVEGDHEPVLTAHPELVRTHDDGWRDLQRIPVPGGTRCAALLGPPYACRIYADRPTNCRDLDIGGDACLFARRRVQLSPDARPVR